MPGAGGPGTGVRRLCLAVVALFLSSVMALATHDAPSPLVAAVARAAEIAMPAPVTSAAATLPPLTLPSVGGPGPATSAAPITLPGVSVPGVPLTIPPVEVTVPTLPAATPAPAPAPPATLRPDGIGPYLGLGTWVDVYDWSTTYARNGPPAVAPGDVDRMAAAGVQTLFIQGSKHDAPTDVLEPELLQAHIDRATKLGLEVVVWFLPTLEDVGRDLQRLTALARLRNIDGIAVDIEARNVGDVNVRNDRLIELSAALRRALPGRFIGGIVLPPVVLEAINPNFWPAFPYRQIAPFYDVWMTMGYWTNRKSSSGYRDAYRYTKENVDRLRNNLGQPNAPVHPIGGIGHTTTAGDIEQYKRAVTDVRGIGGSIYDWDTTAPELWANLRPMRLN